MEFLPDGTIKQTLEIPPTLALLPIRDLVVFPYMVVPLMVSREMSVAAVDEALATKDRLVLLCAQTDESEDEPAMRGHPSLRHRRHDHADAQALRRAHQGARAGPDARAHSNVRAEVAVLHRHRRARRRAAAAAGRARGRGAHACGARRPHQVFAGGQAAVARADAGRLRRRGSGAARRPGRVERDHEGADGAGAARGDGPDRAAAQRRRASCRRKSRSSRCRRRIQSRAKEEMSKAQREYFLREQLRQIQSELGGGGGKGDLESLRAQVETRAHAGRGARRGRSAAAAARAGQPRLGRGRRAAHLPRVAGRGAVGQPPPTTSSISPRRARSSTRTTTASRTSRIASSSTSACSS